ncbi:uncharacterized protein DS421_14g467570 [Arachis hypogaea]|nr:uncharacterized protein DS421_14g467570 [Arachis hypogaea]
MQPSPLRRIAAPAPFTLLSPSEPHAAVGSIFIVAVNGACFRRHRAEPPPSSSSRAAAAARAIIAASGSVTVEPGRGQKKEKRPPSPPSQTQEREGARGRGACYRRFYRRKTPLLPLRSVAGKVLSWLLFPLNFRELNHRCMFVLVAVAGVLVAAAVRGGSRSCCQTGSATAAVSFS